MADVYDFIEKEEGLVLHSYQDIAGVWTIGYGSTIYEDGTPVAPNETITEAQAIELMQWEVNIKGYAIRGLIGSVSLNDNQITALVSFTYNLGLGALEQSTLLKKIKINPNDQLIRNEFLKWCKYHKDGKILTSRSLLRRRSREANLYFSPVTVN